MSYLRAIPAARIDKITTQPGDYETELTYHEAVSLEDPDYPDGRTWHSNVGTLERLNVETPIMLHFAINRPVGCLRGESDLAPVLAWLRRYSRWLEDRVRLNAAIRSFLWMVEVPPGRVDAKAEQYRRPPEPGSIVVVEKDGEKWSAVAPSLAANDASLDGRAIRWMIAAGGPGTGLVDFGEAEDANLATAKAMADVRWRFLRRRQAYFGHLLATVTLEAYHRALQLGRLRGRTCELRDIRIGLPDISAADNAELGSAAASVADAMLALRDLGPSGPAFQRAAIRLVLQFAGESLNETEIDAMLGSVETFAPSGASRRTGFER